MRRFFAGLSPELGSFPFEALSLPMYVPAVSSDTAAAALAPEDDTPSPLGALRVDVLLPLLLLLHPSGNLSSGDVSTPPDTNSDARKSEALSSSVRFLRDDDDDEEDEEEEA